MRRPHKLSRLSSDGDRITNLPECVLSHILSHLRTDDAVRTSILSKDWKYKWISSYNVDVDAKYFGVRVAEESFVNFMHRILDSSLYRRSFRLVCQYQEVYSLSHIQTWISTALRHDLESLEVNSYYVEGIVLPCSLLNSTSLRKLKLYLWNSTLNVAAKNCVPNLTSLDICYVEIVNNGNRDTSSTMTLNFPLLKTFRVRCCKWLNVKCVEIYAPSLTTLNSSGPNFDEDYDYSFVIHAPRLATFACCVGIPEKIDLIDGSSVVSATLQSAGAEPDNIELFSNIGSRVVKMVNGFTNLEELKLSEFMARVVSQCHHDKLRQLTLSDPSNAEQLLELLHAAPSLKVLKINMYKWVDYDYGGISLVPSCIVSHLEEVKFDGFFECETPQYNLAKFLLTNGQQLKKITIEYPFLLEKQNEIKEYVSAIRIVDLVFNEWY